MKKKFPANPILMIDDEEYILEGQSSLLVSEGFTNIISISDPRKVEELLASQEIEAVLLDLMMPGISGQEILEFITGGYPEIPVIVITGTNEVAEAVNCMNAGAFDYMVKVVEKSRLVSSVRRAVQHRQLKRENKALSNSLLAKSFEHSENFEDIITEDSQMLQLFAYAEIISKSNEPVLITGETGTGKEMFAKAVFNAGGAEGKLVTVNVAGIDDHSFSDTLFGHRKGAFTGADDNRQGLIRQAAGGALFLDEIGDLSFESQVKLLRLIDNGEYYQLGADLPLKTDARIIAVTNRDIIALTAEGRFRKDLFYRLDTHLINIPPLRERPGDIPLLVRRFLPGRDDQLYSRISDEIKEYPFPGNVRELKALLVDAEERARLSGSIIDVLRDRLSGRMKLSGLNTAQDRFPTIKEAVDKLVSEALLKAGGNQSLAARYLGISRQALSKRLSARRNSCG